MMSIRSIWPLLLVVLSVIQMSCINGQSHTSQASKLRRPMVEALERIVKKPVKSSFSSQYSPVQGRAARAARPGKKQWEDLRKGQELKRLLKSKFFQESKQSSDDGAGSSIQGAMTRSRALLVAKRLPFLPDLTPLWKNDSSNATEDDDDDQSIELESISLGKRKSPRRQSDDISTEPLVKSPRRSAGDEVSENYGSKLDLIMKSQRRTSEEDLKSNNENQQHSSIESSQQSTEKEFKGSHERRLEDNDVPMTPNSVKASQQHDQHSIESVPPRTRTNYLDDKGSPTNKVVNLSTRQRLRQFSPRAFEKIPPRTATNYLDETSSSEET